MSDQKVPLSLSDQIQQLEVELQKTHEKLWEKSDMLQRKNAMRLLQEKCDTAAANQVKQLKAKLNETHGCWEANRKLQESRDKLWKENVNFVESNRKLKESRDKLWKKVVDLRRELIVLKEQSKAVEITRANEIQALLRIANEEAIYHEALKKATSALDESFIRACLDMRSFQESAEIKALDESFLRICNIAKSLRESNKRTVTDLQFLAEQSAASDDYWQYPQLNHHGVAVLKLRDKCVMAHQANPTKIIDDLRKTIDTKSTAFTNLRKDADKKSAIIANLGRINTEQREDITKQAETINNLRELDRQHSRTIADLQKTIGRYQVTNTNLREDARKFSNRLKQSEADKKLAEDNTRTERRTAANLLIQLKGSEDKRNQLQRKFRRATSSFNNWLYF